MNGKAMYFDYGYLCPYESLGGATKCIQVKTVTGLQKDSLYARA